MTHTMTKVSFPVNRAERARRVREMLADLKRLEITLRLNEAGDGFEVLSTGEVKPDILDGIGTARAALLDELVRQEEITEKWKWLLIEHNSQWREEFGWMLEGGHHGQ